MDKNLHYLEVILKAINAIEGYVRNVNDDDFLRNDQLKDACLMRLIVIGEYGDKITRDVKSRFTEIEWQLIKAARNFYVHVYDGVMWPHVWETITEDLPPLKPRIERLINELDKDEQV